MLSISFHGTHHGSNPNRLRDQQLQLQAQRAGEEDAARPDARPPQQHHRRPRGDRWGGDYIEDGEYNDDRGQQRDNGAFGGSSSSSSFRDVSVSSVSYRAKTSNEATAGAMRRAARR